MLKHQRYLRADSFSGSQHGKSPADSVGGWWCVALGRGEISRGLDRGLIATTSADDWFSSIVFQSNWNDNFVARDPGTQFLGPLFRSQKPSKKFMLSPSIFFGATKLHCWRVASICSRHSMARGPRIAGAISLCGGYRGAPSPLQFKDTGRNSLRQTFTIHPLS